MCRVGGKDYSAGNCVLSQSDGRVTLEIDGRCRIDGVLLSQIVDKYGNAYPDYDTFRTAIKNFFVNASVSNTADWTTLIEAQFSYGVRVDLLSSNPTLTRIGNLELHKTLPIHKLMRGCLQKEDGSVNYYLNPTNWAQKSDGTASVLDGTDGDVQVHLPRRYFKCEKITPIVWDVRYSDRQIPGYTLIQDEYVSAFEASLNRTTNRLCSVVNTSMTYRGGTNEATYDGTSKSLLGKPVTNTNLTNFRIYARNKGSIRWNCNVYSIQTQIFWLFAVEYATLNSQLPVAGLDANGYRTGGLGNGITTANDTEWLNFNGRNPFCNCGVTNSLGNGSGEVSFTVTDFGGAGVNRSFTANRYRGIENPFGHLWKWTDGVLVDVKTDAAGGTSKLYTSSDASKFSSVAFTDYDYKGLITRDEGFIKTIMFGASGDIMPTTVGGSSATYFADYFYRDITASVIKGVLFGGYAADGSTAGLVFSSTASSPSLAYSAIGSRLCFI